MTVLELFHVLEVLTSDGDDGDDLEHFFCHRDTTVALCGAPLPGGEGFENDDDTNLCVVCNDLINLPRCVRCDGYCWKESK